MAKKKAAVKKTGRKVGGKKPLKKARVFGPALVDQDSSAYVVIGDATKTGGQSRQPVELTFEVTARDCSGAPIEIDNFVFEVSYNNFSPYSTIVDISIDPSIATITCLFRARADDADTAPGLVGEDLVVTVLTKKSVRVRRV